MYLNSVWGLDIVLHIWLTVTLDVFKFGNNDAKSLKERGLTVILDVFKFTPIVADIAAK